MKTNTNIDLQQLIQERVMPDWVKSFFEIHKTSIDLFVVIMNVLIYQGSESEDVVCCVRLFGKKPIWYQWIILKETIYSWSRWFKKEQN